MLNPIYICALKMKARTEGRHGLVRKSLEGKTSHELSWSVKVISSVSDAVPAAGTAPQALQLQPCACNRLTRVMLTRATERYQPSYQHTW